MKAAHHVMRSESRDLLREEQRWCCKEEEEASSCTPHASDAAVSYRYNANLSVCFAWCHAPHLPRDDVNMVAVLKAMGAEADQEIMQLAGNDETLSALLVPTIQ
eukprot:1160045-Pelagomonas_calceolata.AAC.1